MRDNISFPNSESFNQLSNIKKIELLITAASLAPSTINTQPWLFSIKDNLIELFLNPARKLPMSDPTGRQAYISLGASWANLELLAESYGLKYKTESLPCLDESQPVARMIIENFMAGKDELPTRTAIELRHTNRSLFEKKSLPKAFVEKIKFIPESHISLHIIEDENTKNEITPIILDAIYEIFSKKEWCRELSNWVKPSLKKYRDGMPGYYLGIPFPISFLMSWVLKYGSVADKQFKMHKKVLAWVPAYGIITAQKDTPSTWFKIGVTFERIAIEAEKNNIKIGILTAPTEVESASQKLKTILNTQNSPQIFFRLGYTQNSPILSPRLFIGEIIKPV